MSPRAAAFPRLFAEAVGRPLRMAVPLRDHSHFRIGGPADFFFEAASAEELRAALAAARASAVPAYVIGGGCNLLFDDAGFRGLIVKNGERGLGLDRLPSGGARVAALSGTPLSELVDLCAANALTGLEFLTGIPGTIGGAVYGNAGAFGCCLGEALDAADLLDADGVERRETRDYFDFSYRHSRLKSTGEVVLRAVFSVVPGEAGAIRARMDEITALRESRHPSPETAYAGSYFKNPVGPDGVKTAAGLLLDQVGAKEVVRGGAAVFPGHANFLYNRENATAADVLALARELKNRVRVRFGIELEEEVIHLRAEAGA